MRALVLFIQVLDLVFQIEGEPQFEVTNPHPLTGQPVRILPVAYLAHFTQEGKF